MIFKSISGASTVYMVQLLRAIEDQSDHWTRSRTPITLNATPEHRDSNIIGSSITEYLPAFLSHLLDRQ